MNVLQAILELLKDPTSNLIATSIAVGMLVLVVIIIVLVLLAVAMPTALSGGKKRRRRRKKGKKGAPVRRTVAASADSATSAQPVPARKPRRRLLSRKAQIVLGVAFALAALFVAYHATSTSAYCTGVCHAMTPYQETWKSSSHAGITCTRCHEGRYLTSVVNATTARSRSIYLQILGATGGGDVVPDGRCLQCHGKILDGVITGRNAVSMSHKEVADAGASCQECHGDQGHTSAPVTGGMSRCLGCHDGTKVASNCDECHRKGADASIQFTSQDFGKPVSLPNPPTCGGCHDQRPCDKCHGLRMPHPYGFAEPEAHARLAAFDQRTEVCFRCHTSYDCSACHSQFPAHIPNWKHEHTAYTWDDPWCHNCHDYDNMCKLCHTRAEIRK